MITSWGWLSSFPAWVISTNSAVWSWAIVSDPVYPYRIVSSYELINNLWKFSLWGTCPVIPSELIFCFIVILSITISRSFRIASMDPIPGTFYIFFLIIDNFSRRFVCSSKKWSYHNRISTCCYCLTMSPDILFLICYTVFFHWLLQQHPW